MNCMGAFEPFGGGGIAIHNCSSINGSILQCANLASEDVPETLDSLINYSALVYCSDKVSPVGLLFSIILLAFLFLTLATTADDFFCPALEVISKALHLSQNVAGVTLLAFGNGAPEIFASLAGTSKDRPELVISYLFGSGMFLTCIVSGIIILLNPFKMVERPFLRDIIFYLIAVYWGFCLVYKQEITFSHALGFICLYIVYIVVVLVGHHIYQKYLKREGVILDPQPSTSASVSASYVDVPNPIAWESGEDEIAPWGGPPFVRHWNVSGSYTASTERFARSQSPSTLALSTPPPNGHPIMCENCALNPPFYKLLPMYICLNLRDLGWGIIPVDTGNWPRLPWWMKSLQILRSPVVFFLKVTVPVVDLKEVENNWCKSLNALHCITSPMFFLFAIGYGNTWILDLIPIWGIVLGEGMVFAITVMMTSNRYMAPAYHMVFAFLGFCVSVTWIYVIANEIVSLLMTIGLVLNISDSILGLTVLAWGNSISDLVADITVAKQGFPKMGMSACFGGPLFNLLLGLGISFSFGMIQKPGKVMEVAYDHSMTILTAFLCASLLSSLIIIPLMKFQMKRIYGIYLICLYILFFIVILINEFET